MEVIEINERQVEELNEIFKDSIFKFKIDDSHGFSAIEIVPKTYNYIDSATINISRECINQIEEYFAMFNMEITWNNIYSNFWSCTFNKES